VVDFEKAYSSLALFNGVSLNRMVGEHTVSQSVKIVR
jgi:hypothetical protein